MKAYMASDGKKIPGIRYSISDVWLLASIEHSSGRNAAGIYGIISTGDYLNHAIFTEKEFEEGLLRLSKGGWIEEEDGGFRVSRKFKVRKIKYISPKGYRSSRKLWDSVERLLGATPSCHEGAPAGRYPGFRAEEFRKAVRRYLRAHGCE